jgi:hypothetical protein
MRGSSKVSKCSTIDVFVVADMEYAPPAESPLARSIAEAALQGWKHRCYNAITLVYLHEGQDALFF